MSFVRDALSARNIYSGIVIAIPIVLFTLNARLNPDKPLNFAVDVTASREATAQLYFDNGQGLSEAASQRMPLPASEKPLTLRFGIAPGEYRGFRFDPSMGAGTFTIENVRIERSDGTVVLGFPTEALLPAHQISSSVRTGSRLRVVVAEGANDPQLVLPFQAPIHLPLFTWNFVLELVTIALAVTSAAVCVVVAVLGLISLGGGIRQLPGMHRFPAVLRTLESMRDAGLRVRRNFSTAGVDGAGQLRQIHTASFGFAVLWSALAICVIYPEIFFQRSFPMVSRTWELQDPIVSQLTFIPGVRTIRYELTQHFNLLWSNMRGMGMPILGNEVQAAPLFPLTLLLFWLPETTYWNVLVLSRIILTGAITFLIASQVFGLRKSAAALFMLTYAFGLYMMRWMNHPYQNGVLAGVLYFYAFWRISAQPFIPFGKKRLLNILLLALGAYSMVTCGFPEAAAMSTIIVVIYMSVYFSHTIFRAALPWRQVAHDAIVAHLLAFAFSAAQVFALIEFIGTTNMDFRPDLGLRQHDNIGSYFAWMITRTTALAPRGANIHIFGLIPIFFFLNGLVVTLGSPKRIKPWDVAALLCAAFFLVKVFPLWPWFNTFVGSLPLLRSSWFTVYFLPIFLWSFAYFAAKGLHTFFEGRGVVVRTVLTALVVVVLAEYAARIAGHVSYPELLRVDGRAVAILIFFTAVVLLSLARAVRSESPITGWNLWFHRNAPALIVIFALLEFISFRPNQFGSFDDYRNVVQPDMSKVVQLVQERGLKLTDNRIRELESHWDTRMLSSGGATPDDGASAILQERLRTLRPTLFESAWGGMLPLGKPHFPHSWRFLSTSLFLVDRDHKTPNVIFGTVGFEKLGAVTKDVELYYDPRALPRAFVASECEPVAEFKQAMGKIVEQNDRDLGRVFLEELGGQDQAFCSAYKSEFKRVPISIDDGSRIKLAPVQGPAVLVLNDNFYPGWKAHDEESRSELKIVPANANFRALLLPDAARYTVVFEYVPQWLTHVKVLLAWGVLLLGCLFWEALRATRTTATLRGAVDPAQGQVAS